MIGFDFEAHGLDPDKYVTRRGIVELADKLFGIPLSKSKIDKMAMAGNGPSIDARIGQRELTRIRNAVPFILAQLSEVRS
jgi:hypothetical protein